MQKPLQNPQAGLTGSIGPFILGASKRTAIVDTVSQHPVTSQDDAITMSLSGQNQVCPTHPKLPDSSRLAFRCMMCSG